MAKAKINKIVKQAKKQGKKNLDKIKQQTNDNRPGPGVRRVRKG